MKWAYVFTFDFEGNEVPQIIKEYSGQKWRTASFINVMLSRSKRTSCCLRVILEYFSLASRHNFKFCQ